MKFSKSIISSIILSAVTSSAFAKPPAQVILPVLVPGKVYVGAFGGISSTNGMSVNQYGTAFYTEAEGGPLAVNAFGDTGSRSDALFGLQLGVKDEERLISPRYHVTVTPAAEIEGFYFNNTSFSGDLINATNRLPEHDFVVSYPMNRSVFLANIVMNFNHPALFVQPYVGFGIGGAVVRIAGADATQIAPAEVGVNHYNGNTSDTDAAFAGQIKAGLVYDIYPCLSIFAEYRWLYISNTHYTFGSTVYPAHPATSSWQVDVDPQRANIGTIGLRFNVA